jgi:hypothetical protein
MTTGESVAGRSVRVSTNDQGEAAPRGVFRRAGEPFEPGSGLNSAASASKGMLPHTQAFCFVLQKDEMISTGDGDDIGCRHATVE